MLFVSPLNFYLCLSSLAPFWLSAYLTFAKGVTAISTADLISFFWILVLPTEFKIAWKWSLQLLPRRQFLCLKLATGNLSQCCSCWVRRERPRYKTTRRGQSPSSRGASLTASIRAANTGFLRMIRPSLFIDY